jgi:hypothetical protein
MTQQERKPWTKESETHPELAPRPPWRRDTSSAIRTTERPTTTKPRLQGTRATTSASWAEGSSTEGTKLTMFRPDRSTRVQYLATEEGTRFRVDQCSDLNQTIVGSGTRVSPTLGTICASRISTNSPMLWETSRPSSMRSSSTLQ